MSKPHVKQKPPPIYDVRRAVLGPGDVLVIEAPGPVTTAERELMKAQLREVWPHHRAIVLQNGVKLQIGCEKRRRPSRRKAKRGNQ
jgi:hypothetical protein